MNNSLVKKIILGVLILGVLFGAGYALNSRYGKNQNNNTTQNQSGNTQKEAPQDIEIANKLRQERDVQYGYVYIHPKLIFAPIILREAATKENAQLLVNKYADSLKLKYNDREISVQAVDSTGKVVAGTTR